MKRAPAKVPAGTPPSAFVTKFAPDGKSVIFSTYLGGTVGSDQASSIAVDSSGNAIVVGTTGSNDFPVTSGAYQTVCNPKFTRGPNVEVPNCPGGGGIAAFVSKFSPSGALLYSTFLSGSNTNTTAYAVAVDTSRAGVRGGSDFSRCDRARRYRRKPANTLSDHARRGVEHAALFDRRCRLSKRSECAVRCLYQRVRSDA